MVEHVDIEDAEYTEVVENTSGELEKVYDAPPKRVVAQSVNKQKPFKIDDEDGKPNEEMIQLVMNLKTVSKKFRMDCLHAFLKHDYKWVEKRILKEVDKDEYNLAISAQKMLRDQIKKDKKLTKRINKGK